MANFSGVVKIGDVNDFIAPSQACVLNLDGSKVAAPPKAPAPAPAPKPGGFRQTVTDETTNAIKVSLQDCLACSGCVTTAETMLLQHQSAGELLAKLQDPNVTVVATLSSQSRASLAAEYGLTVSEASARLTGWLKALGVAYVLDVHSARSISLLETAVDFKERLRAAGHGRRRAADHGRRHFADEGASERDEQTLGAQEQRAHNGTREYAALRGSLEDASGGANAGAGTDVHMRACSAELAAATAIGGGGDAAEDTPSSVAPLLPSSAVAGRRHLDGQHSDGACSAPLPMLASACPGWVCYAEKTHGDAILPHLCAAKSPQAVAGTLVKRLLCTRLALDPARVYHVAIMPCFDKKLEASREDFTFGATGGDRGGGAAAQPAVSETDCVLTTSEVHDLLRERGESLQEQPLGALDAWGGGGGAAGRGGGGGLRGVRGGSGGYLEYCLKFAARELYGVHMGPGALPMRRLRNADLQEVSLDCGGGAVLRGALAYGFRNIQNFVRKLKARQCPYDFVEVMACPGGCLNGGGQVRVGAGLGAAQRRLEVLDALYHERADVRLEWPEEDAEAQALRCAAAEAGLDMRTAFHAREKTVQGSLLDW